jgi:hypothetical protein
MASSYLLQESGGKFTEETSSGFLLLEVQPVAAASTFVSRLPRVVTIRSVAGWFEMDAGAGIVKSKFSSILALIAKNRGATQIRYED